MKLKSYLKVLCAVSLAFGLAACESAEVSQTTSDASAVAQGVGDIKSFSIGFIGPLEGSYSQYGIAVRNGSLLAVKQFNEKNGTDIKLIEMDSKGDSTQAVNNYNSLLSQGVAGIVGGTVSGESIAVATAAQASGLPIFSPTATATDFSSIGKNVFRGCYTDPFQAKEMAKFVYNQMKLKNIAVLYNTGNDYATGMQETFIKEFEANGGKITSVEGFNDGDTDFNAQLTSIAATNPDAIFCPNYYGEVALIAEQAKAQGIEIPLVGGDGWDGVLGVISDPAMLEGAVFVNHYSPDQESVQVFLNDYRTAYNTEANSFAVLAYDTTTCLLEAITKTGNLEYANVLQTLQSMEFNGVLGSMKFDDNGDPIKDLAYVTVKDGKYVSYGK